MSTPTKSPNPTVLSQGGLSGFGIGALRLVTAGVLIFSHPTSGTAQTSSYGQEIISFKLGHGIEPGLDPDTVL